MGIQSKKEIQNMKQEIYKLLEKAVDDAQANEIIKKLEQCREALVKLETADGEVMALLLYLYVCQERVWEACQLIAEYSLSLDEMTAIYRKNIPFYIVSKLKESAVNLPEVIYNQMKASDITYDEFYKIFKAYPSGNYARLLILYAREEDRRVDTIVLSNAIKQTLEVERAAKNSRMFYEGENCTDSHIESMLLAYYTERLEDLSYVKDYSEIRKSILEARRHYNYEKEAIMAFSPEWLPGFWIRMIHCLNIIERFDRTIEISEAMELKIKDADYYFYVAEAYYALGKLELAEKNCKRAAALEANQNNLLLLSQIFFTKREYDAAEKTLLETLAAMSGSVENIYPDNTKSFYAERVIKRKLHEIDFRKKLESPYALLFLCYVFQGKLAKAKAFYIEMQEKLGISDMVMISGHLLEVEEYACHHMAEVETEKRTLQSLLINATKKYDELKDVVSHWTKELIELQLTDDSAEITPDDWEDNFSKKMDAMISRMVVNLRKSNADGYDNICKRVEDAFPELSGQAKEFLVSAEQMYDVFQGNVVIDFAPIMVEYCKVFEVLLWEYLDRTGEYAYEIKNNRQKQKYLGTAEYVIKNGGVGKTLWAYLEDIEKITKLRNNSAHKHVTKENPDVIWIRELIKRGKLIETLCGI